MRLLQKRTWPRAPGGQKLQLVPYPIYRSRIATNIARSLSGGLLPLEPFLLAKNWTMTMNNVCLNPS